MGEAADYDAVTHRLVVVAAPKDKDEPDNAREERQLQYLRAGTRRLFQPQSADRLGADRRRKGGCAELLADLPTTPANATRTSAPSPIASRNMVLRADRRGRGQEARSVCAGGRVRAQIRQGHPHRLAVLGAGVMKFFRRNRATIRPTARHEGSFSFCFPA